MGLVEVCDLSWSFVALVEMTSILSSREVSPVSAYSAVTAGYWQPFHVGLHAAVPHLSALIECTKHRS